MVFYKVKRFDLLIPNAFNFIFLLKLVQICINIFRSIRKFIRLFALEPLKDKCNHFVTFSPAYIQRGKLH